MSTSSSPPQAPTPIWLARLRKAFRIGAVALIYWVTASAVLDSFMDHWALGDKWRKSHFNKAINYIVPPPFVYRVLTPWMVNEISDRLPQLTRRQLAERTPTLRERYALRGGNEVEYAVAYYVLLAGYLGTLIVWRANFKLLGRGSPLLWDLAPAVALLLLPMSFMQGGFIYDATELFLTALALHFFMRRRWLLYYLVFFAAVINKESNILLAAWFLAPFTIDRDWRSLFRHGALSVAVGAPPFLFVRWWFRNRPENPLVWKWDANFDYLTSPSSYWSGFDVYATRVPAPEGFHLFNLFMFSAVLILIWRRAYLRPIRQLFLCSAIAFLPLFLLFGSKNEIRVFGPTFAAFVLLGTHALREAVNGPDPETDAA